MKFIHEVWVNSDLTEGKGYDYIVARFSDLLEAQAAAKGANTQGTDGYVKSHTLWDSVLEFTTWEKAKVSGLAKLTPIERLALGLTTLK